MWPHIQACLLFTSELINYRIHATMSGCTNSIFLSTVCALNIYYFVFVFRYGGQLSVGNIMSDPSEAITICKLNSKRCLCSVLRLSSDILQFLSVLH